MFETDGFGTISASRGGIFIVPSSRFCRWTEHCLDTKTTGLFPVLFLPNRKKVACVHAAYWFSVGHLRAKMVRRGGPPNAAKTAIFIEKSLTLRKPQVNTSNTKLRNGAQETLSLLPKKCRPKNRRAGRRFCLRNQRNSNRKFALFFPSPVNFKVTGEDT